MKSSYILLDSNILVYALDSSNQHNKVAQSYIQNNQRYLAVSHQNISESLRVLSHSKFSSPMTIEEAQSAISAIVDQLEVISPNYKTMEIALALIKKHQLSGNKVFDAYLAATALSNNILTIATHNIKDFPFENIKIINPFA